MAIQTLFFDAGFKFDIVVVGIELKLIVLDIVLFGAEITVVGESDSELSTKILKQGFIQVFDTCEQVWASIITHIDVLVSTSSSIWPIRLFVQIE